VTKATSPLTEQHSDIVRTAVRRHHVLVTILVEITNRDGYRGSSASQTKCFSPSWVKASSAVTEQECYIIRNIVSSNHIRLVILVKVSNGQSSRATRSTAHTRGVECSE